MSITFYQAGTFDYCEANNVTHIEHDEEDPQLQIFLYPYECDASDHTASTILAILGLPGEPSGVAEAVYVQRNVCEYLEHAKVAAGKYEAFDLILHYME